MTRKSLSNFLDGREGRAHQNSEAGLAPSTPHASPRQQRGLAQASTEATPLSAAQSRPRHALRPQPASSAATPRPAPRRRTGAGQLVVGARVLPLELTGRLRPLTLPRLAAAAPAVTSGWPRPLPRRRGLLWFRAALGVWGWSQPPAGTEGSRTLQVAITQTLGRQVSGVRRPVGSGQGGGHPSPGPGAGYLGTCCPLLSTRRVCAPAVYPAWTCACCIPVWMCP